MKDSANQQTNIQYNTKYQFHKCTKI